VKNKKYLTIFLILLIIDRISKILAIKYLSNFYTLPILKNIFHLTYVENTGIAFGFFQGKNLLFLILNIFILGLFIKLFLDTKDRTIRFSLLLIIAGGTGNLLDRFIYKKVIDFIDFRIWPVFNFSDSMVSIGGVILFLKFLLNERKKKDKNH